MGSRRVGSPDAPGRSDRVLVGSLPLQPPRAVNMNPLDPVVEVKLHRVGATADGADFVSFQTDPHRE